MERGGGHDRAASPNKINPHNFMREGEPYDMEVPKFFEARMKIPPLYNLVRGGGLVTSGFGFFKILKGC